MGSPRAYLSLNRRASPWVYNYGRPVIGYPRDLHVNYARFNGVSRNVSHSFQHLWKALRMFSLKKTSQKLFLIPKFVIDTIY